MHLKATNANIFMLLFHNFSNASNRFFFFVLLKLLFMPNRHRMWLSSSQAIKVNAPMTCGAEDCEISYILLFDFLSFLFMLQSILLLHKNCKILDINRLSMHCWQAFVFLDKEGLDKEEEGGQEVPFLLIHSQSDWWFQA